MASSVFRKIALCSLSFSLLLSPICSSQLCQSASAAIVTSNPAFKFVRKDDASGLQEYRLNSNGLSILLQEKHNSPVVTVMVVYKVGSRNEAVGYTGSTHFLEHMMFKGTPKHDPLKFTSLDDLLKPMGGLNNATTSFDRTNYFEVIPSKNLGVCLEVEADRMRHALLRNSDRQSEMTVVRNELERSENFASSILDTQLFATAFREHPYHHPTIGWRSDVEGVPTERLKQFYNDFYYPNNATLLVMGDFQTAEALKLINQYFSKVPASPKAFPKVYTTEPPQEGERRFIVQRGDEMPKLVLGYHIPAAKDKDTYPLEVLASILGDQKRQSSRLYKKLVDSGLASQAYAFNYSMKDPGLFTVFASANTGAKLETIEKTIEDEFTNLANVAATDAELDRAKKAVWKRLKLETDDPMNFAQQLADAEAVADWTWWLNLEKNIKAVTAADVQRVAKKYFSASNRTVGYYLPKEKASESKDSSKATSMLDDSKPEVKPSQPVDLAPAPKDLSTSPQGALPEDVQSKPKSYKLSRTEIAAKDLAAISTGSNVVDRALVASKTKKKVLANGITVYAMPVRGSGIIAISSKLKGGESCGSKDKTLLPTLLGEMLNKGSVNLSKEKLADTLETMGTSLDPQVQTFWTEIDAEVVTEDFDKLLGVMSESIQNPLLQNEELEKLKKQKESEIKDAMVETAELAANKLLGQIYKPDCVYYSRPFNEQLEELSSITVDDLKSFHKKYYVANNAVIAIVGDIDADKAFELAEKNFASWQKGEASDLSVKACACDDKTKGKQIVSPLPDKSNVDILMGYPANVSITSKDFCAAQLANAALGHDTISSRLAELRQKHGLTYGIHSAFSENAESWSPWLISLSVNPENTKKAMNLVRGIVADFVSKGITDEELKTEKQRLAGEYIVNRMRTPKQLADALTKYGAIGLGPEFMDKYPAMLAKVTKAEANAAINKYMKVENLVTSLAGSIPKDIKGK